MADSSSVPDAWCDFASELADESRRIQRTHLRGDDRRLKPDRTFVTALDLCIEERCRSLIADRYPDHGVIGEEGGADNGGAELVWVLDPIDGTASFIAGMPVWSTLIALALEGEPVVGIIDVPAIDARWVGVRGRPTLKNGAPCRVRRGGDLSGAIMSVSSPDFYSEYERPVLDAMRAATGWRVYGGAALSYGLLAAGGTDLALDAGLKLYDFAPFRPIVEGAGGTVTDWDGEPITLSSGSRILAAGDASLHAGALAKIRGLQGEGPRRQEQEGERG